MSFLRYRVFYALSIGYKIVYVKDEMQYLVVPAKLPIISTLSIRGLVIDGEPAVGHVPIEDLERHIGQMMSGMTGRFSKRALWVAPSRAAGQHVSPILRLNPERHGSQPPVLNVILHCQPLHLPRLFSPETLLVPLHFEQ